jgi:hypothetical protein
MMSYLETAHRNIAWFNARFRAGELDMHPPFQRNPVWTTPQKSYLVDTILRSLPVPELYMQDVVDEQGNEKYIVVDGQQRIRSCLEFISGDFTLNQEESPEWGEASFDDLSPSDKQKFFSYKFVVRTLPAMPEPELRNIFKRLNKNVVALNPQELRHATYWGPFIKMVEKEAEDNSFWVASGLFSTVEVRRMLDIEHISELVVGYLHGPQEKKKKLDQYYQVYEESFEQSEEVQQVFYKTTGEIGAILPDIRQTRWHKKSDFYTLFLVMADLHPMFPLSRDRRESVRGRLLEFGEQVTDFLKIDLERTEEVEKWPGNVARYGIAVERAASDLNSRRARNDVIRTLIGDCLAQTETH